jgi:hypothetical protein
VVADMIEGVVVTNALAGTAADRCRAALWNVVEPVPIGPAVVSPASVSDARLSRRLTRVLIDGAHRPGVEHPRS